MFLLGGFSSSGRAVDSHSTGRGIDAPNLQVGRRDGVVNVTDSKSVPFGGAGSNPADVSWVSFLGFCGIVAAWLPPEEQIRVRFPAEAWGVLVAQLADRPLHTRKAQGSIPCENLLFFSGLVRGRSCVQSAQRTRFFRPLLSSDMV